MFYDLSVKKLYCVKNALKDGFIVLFSCAEKMYQFFCFFFVNRFFLHVVLTYLQIKLIVIVSSRVQVT